MEHTEGSFTGARGTTIFTQTWRPAGDPRALIVLAHGYGEHSGRYGHVARRLVDAGYAVAALDHRGHGRSGGRRGLFRDVGELSTDLGLFRARLAAEHGELPQVLLGHSVGGAVVMDHLLGDHPPTPAVVLSAPYLRNAAAVLPPLRILAPVLGRLLPTAPTQKVPATAVSRDAAVVAAYEADPLVLHAPVPAATGAALLGMEARLLRRAAEIDEPVLLVHGTEDQLADVEGTRVLGRTIGAADVTVRTYDGLHHEVFNEPEQDEVIAEVVAWLDERVPA
jgi:alpha-beta hydrolase superfamily lysophospholipase